MVTPTPDPFFEVKGQKKGQNLKFVRFQRLMSQTVGLGHTIKSFMVTLTSNPFFGVKSQQKGQNFNFVRFQQLMSQIVGLGQTIKSSHGIPDIRPFLHSKR